MSKSNIIALFALAISILTALYTVFTQLRHDRANLNWIYQTVSDENEPGKFYLELSIYNQSSIAHSITSISIETINGQLIGSALKYPVLIMLRENITSTPRNDMKHFVYSDYVPFNIEPQHSKKITVAFSGQLPKTGFNIVTTGTWKQNFRINRPGNLFISQHELNSIFDKDLGGTVPELKTIDGNPV